MSESATELDISISLNHDDPHSENVQAQYLYVVTNKTTMEEFSGIQVRLQILKFDHNDIEDNDNNNNRGNVDIVDDDDDVNYSLSHVMELLLGPFADTNRPSPYYHRRHHHHWNKAFHSPAIVKKAAALTLFLDDDTSRKNDDENDNNTNTLHRNDANLALVSFLKNHVLSTTPSGLACILALIDAIVQQKQASFGHDIHANDHPHQQHLPDHQGDPLIRTFRAL